MLNDLICPNCNSTLECATKLFNCSNCRIEFPIVNGIPIILAENSVFSAAQVAQSDKTYYAEAVTEIKNVRAKRRLRKSLPKITKSWEREKFYEIINRELSEIAGCAGLQLGAGEVPVSINGKIQNIEWTHSDVDLGFKPDIVADATGLPFRTASFDLVFADNVLEHVFDLSQAVSEIQRVTKPGGLIAISIPFLYPFHGMPYDFTRLTPCGLRAAFRQTENLFLTRDSGAFVALALQLDARLINFFKNRNLRGGAVVASRFLFSGLKHLDRIYTTTRHISSAASLLYVGRKTQKKLSRKEIMKELQSLYGDLK